MESELLEMERGEPVACDVCGESMTLARWSDRSGLPIGTLHKRLLRGWDIHEAHTTTTHAGKRHSPRERCLCGGLKGFVFLPVVGQRDMRMSCSCAAGEAWLHAMRMRTDEELGGDDDG